MTPNTAVEGVGVEAGGSRADQAGFEAVFAAEHEAMVRLAYLLLGSQAQAEDAVQDAFARLLDRFDEVENPGGFVRTATVNRCRDLLRRRSVERKVLRRLRPPPDTELEADEMLDALAGLTRVQREVIVLRFYLGCSTSEIAELVGVAEGTIRSRMQRGIEQLRGALT